MKGELVTVHLEVDTGETDWGGSPIMEPRDIDVEDVLVAPGGVTDVTDSTRPAGVKVEYTLQFPKTFNMPLRGTQITVRGGDPLDVVGDPDHYTLANTPTRWWMPVEVGRVDG